LNCSDNPYKKLLLLGIILLIPFFAFVQNLNIPLNQSFNVELERQVLLSEEIVHSSFKPILVKDSKQEGAVNSLLTLNTNKSWVGKRLFYQHFITLDSANFKLTIDPLINFEGGFDNEFDSRTSANLYKNTRGFVARLQLGKKVAIESSFRENQAVLPFYLHERVRTQRAASGEGVAFGQGRVKTFKENGYDFAMSSAYLSVSVNKHINIQAGHGKHFVGNGHRSLLLSDLAFNAPFLRINSNWFDGKLQYQNLFTLYQDLNRLTTITISEGLFERKQAATHYLEFSPNHKWSFGLFESTVFPSLDSSGNIPVGANFWVPVMFLNTLIEGQKKKGNSKVGVNISYKLARQVQLYGQAVLQSSVLSIQLGTKIYLHKNVMLQVEYNQINAQSGVNLFSHYNESLAHPIAGFDADEFLGIAQFQKNRWLSRVSANAILNSDVDVAYIDLRQSFIVNPSYNFTIHVGTQVRRADISRSMIQIEPLIAGGGYVLNSNFIYVGLSTNLQNIYFNY
jgi:hypothetical protein